MLYLPSHETYFTVSEANVIRKALKHRANLSAALIAGLIKPEVLREAVGYTQRYGDYDTDFNQACVEEAISVFEASRAMDKVIYGGDK